MHVRDLIPHHFFFNLIVNYDPFRSDRWLCSAPEAGAVLARRATMAKVLFVLGCAAAAIALFGMGLDPNHSIRFLVRYTLRLNCCARSIRFNYLRFLPYFSASSIIRS